MKSVKSLIIALCSPINQFLLGLLFAAVLMGFKRTVLAKRFAVLSVAWLLVCSQYTFSSWLLKPLEHTAPSIELTDPRLHKATHILPLAGYYFANSDLAEHALWSRSTIQRLSNAYFLYQHIKKPIILTGGPFLAQSQTPYNEFAAQYFMARGIPKEDIILVPSSPDGPFNTQTELQEAFAYLSQGNPIIVSSATHMRRVDLLMSQLGLVNKILFPVDFLTSGQIKLKVNAPAIDSLHRVYMGLYEYLSYFYYDISIKIRKFSA
jgi:uncharacterized SAM-binding protein YcdF (DUF218 family)